MFETNVSLEVSPQLIEDLVLKIKSIVADNIAGSHLVAGWKVEAQLAAQEIIDKWLREQCSLLGECRTNFPEHHNIHQQISTCTNWQHFQRIK